MALWISGSKHQNNWHLAQHTYFSESLLLTSSIPGQLPWASFLSLRLAISYGTWNSNSPVPLHDPWHIEHTHMSNSSTYWHSPHAGYSLLQEKTFSKLPDTLHNYHLSWYMPLFHSTPILVSREVQECPGLPLSLWNSCCPSSPEKARYLTCTSTITTQKKNIKLCNILCYCNDLYYYIIHQNEIYQWKYVTLMVQNLT